MAITIRSSHALRQTRQRGIGVVGFIVGILVGLAVALGIAVYITKAPSPFSDKSGQRTPEQQAEEERKLQGWDPNAGLMGKRGAAPATTAPADAVPDTSGETPMGDKPVVTAPTTTPTTPAAKASVPVDDKALLAEKERKEKERKEKERKEKERLAKEQADRANATNDPVGALVQQRTAKPTETKPADSKPTPSKPATPAPATNNAANDGHVYFVQAGAFSSRNDADAQRARLGLAGLSARVTERDNAGRTVYRVRLGPFNNAKDAERARAQVQGAGMESALVRVQR